MGKREMRTLFFARISLSRCFSYSLCMRIRLSGGAAGAGAGRGSRGGCAADLREEAGRPQAHAGGAVRRHADGRDVGALLAEAVGALLAAAAAAELAQRLAARQLVRVEAAREGGGLVLAVERLVRARQRALRALEVPRQERLLVQLHSTARTRRACATKAVPTRFIDTALCCHPEPPSFRAPSPALISVQTPLGLVHAMRDRESRTRRQRRSCACCNHGSTRRTSVSSCTGCSVSGSSVLRAVVGDVESKPADRSARLLCSCMPISSRARCMSALSSAVAPCTHAWHRRPCAGQQGVKTAAHASYLVV